MLTLLTIKNFALIDALEIEFSNGFSIITGETGAGKSILLGALGLLQGKRADLGSLKDKQEKCIIEGHFCVKGYRLENLFEMLELDYEELTIIRREILPSGKSRAFVNDSPVNLNDLQELSRVLIDIHSQAQTGELQEQAYQIHILDAVANNESVLLEYQDQLKKYKKLNKTLSSLEQQREDLLKEQDYNSFLLQELEQAELSHLDQEALEEQLQSLTNVELVLENLGHSIRIVEQEQLGILPNLKDLKSAMGKIRGVSKAYQDIWDRIDSVEIELSDICNELEQASFGVAQDPEQLDLINSKLQLLYTLQKKHQVNTVEELIHIEKELSSKAFLASDLEADIEQTKIKVGQLEASLEELSNELTTKRKQAVPVLEEQILEILTLVGMPNSSFRFEFHASDQFLFNGKDHIQLLFSANKGMDYGLLKKVASGGEMSRIMLAIKATLARYSSLPTIIFDEIDTGVSGEIADKMGHIMFSMSKHMQVFSITHLPQIAAKGNQHYKVFKTSDSTTTTSSIIALGPKERITEIATMLSGKDITSSALEHARELLQL
ncbi:DNA repair protein RecN [Myroides sp. LJL116]